MATHSAPLSHYPVLHSSDPDLVRDRLFSVYGATSFEYGKDDQAFMVRANHLQLGAVGLSYCEYASEVTVGFGEDPIVRQFFNIDGTAAYDSGGKSGEIDSGSWTPALPADSPLKLQFKPDYRQLVLRIDTAALQRNLGLLLDRKITNLAFGEAPVSNLAMTALRRRVFHLAADFNMRGASFSKIAAAEIERMVIMKFLMSNRHNYIQHLMHEPASADSSAVKKVEEYIEANWDKAIDIETLSAVAGVSARSLFRQFKKDRGYSPSDFAKRIRLSRAREMLEEPAEATSIIQIALKCGFQNPGHFAHDFRLAFGELPSDTLKRGKRRQSRC